MTTQRTEQDPATRPEAQGPAEFLRHGLPAAVACLTLDLRDGRWPEDALALLSECRKSYGDVPEFAVLWARYVTPDAEQFLTIRERLPTDPAARARARAAAVASHGLETILAPLAEIARAGMARMRAVDAATLPPLELFDLYKEFRRRSTERLAPDLARAVRARLAVLDVAALTPDEHRRLRKRMRPGTVAANDFPALALALTREPPGPKTAATAPAAVDLTSWDRPRG